MTNNLNRSSSSEREQINDVLTSPKPEKKREEITWPEEDLAELITHMEKMIPEGDNLAYGTRLEKFEWQNVTFKNYTVEQCKKTWTLLQKRTRRYRLLSEVLEDAKKLISSQPFKKRFRHPDQPKRPSSSFFCFFLKKRDKFIEENPGLPSHEVSKKLALLYKTLPPEKKEKYEKLAAISKQEYEEKLKLFMEAHPDLLNTKSEKPVKPSRETIPKRPQTPFGCFYCHELQSANIAESDKLAFKETCKETWKAMSDKKKVFWINAAEYEVHKYEEALKKYLETHPDYVAKPMKPNLTKEEILIKEREAGKPTKPPMTAYGYFTSILLQSEEIKQIPSKERLIFVSNQWRERSEQEKQQYREHVKSMTDQFKIDFESYLSKLPAEQREIERAKHPLEAHKPKRRKTSENENEEAPKSKKRKSKKSSSRKSKSSRSTRSKKIALEEKIEPEQPPISVYKYFVQVYKGAEKPSHAWKTLGAEEKHKFENELTEKKREYIEQFEKFLKSLNKAELEQYSKRRAQATESRDNENDEEEEEEEDEEEEADEESSSASEASSEEDDN